MIKRRKYEEGERFATDMDRYVRYSLDYCGGYNWMTASRTLMVSDDREKFEFYLRFKANGWPENTLVIARIAFSEVRLGHGRRFIKFIEDLAPIYALKHIAIEEYNPSSLAFGKALGFKVYDDSRGKALIKELCT